MSSTAAQSIPDFAGEVITPEHPDYDSARKIWNAMIDRRPAIIARCTSPADVASALAFARATGLRVAVRGGGHSMPGHSIIDDGLVIDLSPLRQVSVDLERNRVRAGGGSLLASLDAATLKHGLVVPAGAVSHTGAGGLILGGGFGHIMRKYGLTIDSLLSAEVVLADGTIVRASNDEYEDLFWALRGGGGNFGVVTEFEFEMHPMGPVVFGTCFHQPERAWPALERWRAEALGAVDELNWMSFFRKAPPLPWVRPDLVDHGGLISLVEWSGDPEVGEPLVRELIAELDPDSSSIEVIPFMELQTMFDVVQAPGNHAYAKAGFINDISDAALEAMIEHGSRLPSWRSQLEVMPLGGAVARVPHDATAFAHRSSHWVFNVVSVWDDPAATEENVQWARETYDALAPFATGGAYVNYMGGEEPGGSHAAFGDVFDQLQAIKRIYDPDNVFSHNQNIAPTSAS